MESVRVAVVRSSLTCLKEDDLPSLLDLFDEDLELIDPLYNAVVKGKREVAELWEKRQTVAHSLVLGDIIEVGDAVVVAVHHDFYDRDGGRVSAGVPEVHRLTFREDRIAKVQITALADIPEEVQQLLA